MRKYNALLIIFLSVQIMVLAQTGAARRLIAETNHSTIQFSVPISNGLTRITGKFNEFTIDIDLIGIEITQAKIVAIIKVNSINTGNAGRDEDLKTKDFFETEKFPEMKFISERIERIESGYLAHGEFQMHGVTKSIAIPFQVTGQPNENVFGFTSRFSIKRSDYEVGTEWKHTTDDHFIGDEIGVEIDFWTKKPRTN